uniref:NADH-ubiquinone oxidoreductase chain 2 n=1 Tax=Phrynobatrachus keniensis TaxID=467738 RepID=S4V1A0_9NEOB|nr:NADH dehydrogenase subunit 2 [Phrynobatrachus keniensis]
MNPMATTIFALSLAFGTTITLTSHHWLLAWVGLEINTIAILPLMTKTHHPRAIEAATKYFLTQATASALLLFSALLNAYKTGHWDPTSMTETPTIIMSLALMTKLGLAPMHFWMPETLQGITLTTGLILSTWQKIAPMTLLLQISESLNTYLITFIAVASISIGGWAGINQTQLRKIMAFSSIGHLGWMIIIIKFNPHLTTFNFVLYLFMTASLFLAFVTMSSTSMPEVLSSWTKSPVLAMTIMLALLSLAGLPPLTGFAPKLLISLELIKQNMTLLTSLILFLSLLALFFYLRLTFFITLVLSPNTTNSLISWHLSTTSNFTLAVSTIITLFMFTLSPTLLTIT